MDNELYNKDVQVEPILTNEKSQSFVEINKLTGSASLPIVARNAVESRAKPI